MADAGRQDAGKRGGRTPRAVLPRLKRYAAKWDFKKTAEPSHAVRSTGAKQLIFVVQKHAASRLHWDFRLKWQGTLRSWAVPKGPSLDPAVKRLAVEVEDHPIAYAKFAGDIPKGEYGGGHVDIWDNGHWEPIGDVAKALKKGHLEFELFGQKLSGRWHLVRTRMQGKAQQWLLMKAGDFAARVGADADVIDAGKANDDGRMVRAHKLAKPVSVPKPVRGGAPKPRSAKSKGSHGKALPATIKPQLATHSGILRQPRYLGLRADRDPKTVVREEPEKLEAVVKKETSKRGAATPAKAAPGKAETGRAPPARRAGASAGKEARVGTIKVSHPDRVLFAHDGVTKLQLAAYFDAVGEVAMPHYRDRPLSILRNTHGSQPFFQKHFLEKSGAGLRVVKIPNADKDPAFVVCDSPEGLVHLAQVGAVELHSWGGR